MGDTIYIPKSGVWFDTPLICIQDAFPGKSVPEANEIMIGAAKMMEGFLKNHGQESVGIIWMNVLHRTENPDGMFGRFRIYPKYKNLD